MNRRRRGHASFVDAYQAEPDDHRCTEPLDDGTGDERVICQDAVGEDVVEGGGEFPDRDRPPEPPAPGAADPADNEREQPQAVAPGK